MHFRFNYPSHIDDLPQIAERIAGFLSEQGVNWIEGGFTIDLSPSRSSVKLAAVNENMHETPIIFDRPHIPPNTDQISIVEASKVVQRRGLNALLHGS